MDYKQKIKILEKRFSETNVDKDECLSKETRKQINRTYYQNQQKRIVDGILNDVKNRNSIKEEVHSIVEDTKIKTLCQNCKEEVIIATIIVYCLKLRNTSYQVETSTIWKKYGLTWKKYGLIISRLLQQTREKQKVKNKYYVDNEDFIRL